MANLGDISKINLPNGNVVNIKDTTARAQANWNTNNGVKNFATENSFSHTGYFKEVAINGQLKGYVTIHIDSVTSTDTHANTCALIVNYVDGASSQTRQIPRGEPYTLTTDFGTHIIKDVCIYSSDNYVHSSGDTVTVTNLMVCPKSLYDADSTYEPYSLPNTKITPELIELVDSGAKNLIPVNSGTATQRYRIDVTLPAGEYMLYVGGLTSTDTNSSTCQIIAMTSPTGTVVSPYVMATRETGKYYSFTLTDTCNAIYVYASDSYAHSSGDTVTFSNLMICTKAAWDVSQKYVPYGVSNAELTNNISITDITSEITVTSGYTLSAFSNLWKQGNHVWGQLIISIDSGEISTSQTQIAHINRAYAPRNSYIDSVRLGNSAYNVSNSGYLFITNNGVPEGGQIIVSSYDGSNKFVNAHIDYTI